MTCPEKVKIWPQIVISGMVRLKTWQSFRLFLLGSSISIRGQTSRGWQPPRCGLGWRNGRCGRGPSPPRGLDYHKQFLISLLRKWVTCWWLREQRGSAVVSNKIHHHPPYVITYTGWAENNVPNFGSVLKLNDTTGGCEIWMTQCHNILLLMCKFGRKSIYLIVTDCTKRKLIKIKNAVLFSFFLHLHASVVP